MSGAFIKVTVMDQALREAMAKLAARDNGLVESSLKNIGEYLVQATRRRFDTGTAPDGSRWAPLNPAYAATKKGSKILVGAGMRGGLEGSVVWQLAGTTLTVGTNKVYGAIHQFGGAIRPRNGNALVFRLGGKLVHAQKVTIPARPWLGIADEDRTEMTAIVRDHVNEVWRT